MLEADDEDTSDAQIGTRESSQTGERKERNLESQKREEGETSGTRDDTQQLHGSTLTELRMDSRAGKKRLRE